MLCPTYELTRLVCLCRNDFTASYNIYVGLPCVNGKREADRKAAWVGLRLIHATVDFQLASVLWNPQTVVGGESG